MRRNKRRRAPKRDPSEKFHKQISSYRYRDKRTGHYTKKRKGKFVSKERYLTLQTVNTRTGEIREYGKIREKSLRRLSTKETRGSNVFLKRFFQNQKMFNSLAKKNATGVMVTIRAKGKRKKDVSIKTKIIFDTAKAKDAAYIQRLVLGKIMKMLGARKFRLSDEQISKHKKYFQLSGVVVKVDYYSGPQTVDDDEDEDDDEE